MSLGRVRYWYMYMTHTLAFHPFSIPAKSLHITKFIVSFLKIKPLMLI